jgi:hypothetical protein
MPTPIQRHDCHSHDVAAGRALREPPSNIMVGTLLMLYPQQVGNHAVGAVPGWPCSPGDRRRSGRRTGGRLRSPGRQVWLASDARSVHELVMQAGLTDAVPSAACAGDTAVLAELPCWRNCRAGGTAVLAELPCWRNCRAGDTAVLAELLCWRELAWWTGS